jgi:hypothetical protein
MNLSSFENLLGQTLVSVTQYGDERIEFKTDTDTYNLMHYQDCCESVYIESVVGDLQYLVGTPITLAEETVGVVGISDGGYGDQQYTFYKLATIKGYVDIRWNGESNGYYSISVYFTKVDTDETN